MKKFILTFFTLFLTNLYCVDFATCASCHGEKAERSALGKSKIIKGWSAKQIEDALHGYKDGSYGGAYKGIMKGQVIKLDDDNIKKLAEHISKL